MAAAPAAPVKTPNDAEDKCPACAQHIDAASSSHKCVICQRAIHAWCGDAEGDEGYAQQRRCPDCRVSDKVEEAEPATPSTKKETKGKYVPKRKGFEIPDGFVKKNITEILKGKKISRLWEHFEVYAKESSHVCICRLCGAQVKNDVLRTGALQPRRRGKRWNIILFRILYLWIPLWRRRRRRKNYGTSKSAPKAPGKKV